MDRSKNKKSIRKKLSLVIIFIFGLMITLYPIISQWYYSIEASEEVRKFKEEVENTDKKEIEERLLLAEAYNRTLDPSRVSDPFTDLEKKGIKNYARMLEIHEKMGYLELPSLAEEIPIYAGTSDLVLQKGVGHLEGTSLPIGGKSSHSVLTAHRGLPNARLFTDLDKVKKGDRFYIHILDQVLAYKVDQILVVEPWDFTPVLITEDRDYVTLLTCTPYGINSHRLLVRGQRVPYVAPIKEIQLKNTKINFMYKRLLYLSAFIILILIYILYNSYKKYRGMKNED